MARTAVGPGVAVETVFLGRDQAWNALAPLLFESRVYGGRLDGERLLYATWGAAAQGHAVQVARCQQALGEAAP